MVEQDYIMRLIKELIRTLLKLLFHIDLDNPASELYKETEKQGTLQELLDMVNAGNINEAENKIYEMTSDGDTAHLKTALLFYSYLNEKNTDFLEAHDFSREEVMQGVKYLVGKYGLESMAETFLSDL